MDEHQKHPGGRPSKYEDVDLEHVAKLVKAGLTDEQIGVVLGVTRATIHNWKTHHKEFFDTLRENKPISDGKVVRSLFERACGYEHYEDKVFMSDGVPVTETIIKHYPPDPTSMIFWLKNRQPDKWRDKVDHDHTSKGEKISMPVMVLDNDTSKALDKLGRTDEQ